MRGRKAWPVLLLMPAECGYSRKRAIIIVVYRSSVLLQIAHTMRKDSRSAIEPVIVTGPNIVPAASAVGNVEYAHYQRFRLALTHTAPQRIQRLRKPGFNLQAESLRLNKREAACVDRTTKWFGNPFTIESAKAAGCSNGQGWVVWAFKEWLKPAGDPQFRGLFPERRAALLANLWRLRGKNLACFCGRNEPCHADVLLRLANASARMTIQSKAAPAMAPVLG
jgi:Domain of unknown function (DUF4326)